MGLSYLVKVPAFSIIMAAEKVAFCPPSTATPKGEEIKKFGSADLITRSASWFPQVAMGIYWTTHLLEVAAILAREYPSPLSDRVLSALFKNPAIVNRLAVTPLFFVGFLLIVAGGVVRQICYDTLGKFFTFQLALLKEHRLVTSGPYSIVRHPSYAAVLAAQIGLVVVQLLPGSYVFECDILDTQWKAVIVGLWLLWFGSVGRVAFERVSKEDEVLRKEFGAEWEEWAEKTPYKLIPLIH